MRRTRESDDQGRAHLLADALDQVEHARGKARLEDEVHQERAAERRPLRGLEHDGVARGQRGAHFHVESMKGAFHGVMTTVGPAGMRSTVLWVPFEAQRRDS